MSSFRTTIQDWVTLTKPRVSFLVLVTVIPAIYLGNDHRGEISFSFLGIVLLGTLLMSSASFILNQYIERERDAKMYRTKERPIPSGSVSPNTALIVGIGLVIASFVLLYNQINLLTALCAFGAFLGYIFLYTIFLKPRTDQNIVIGGIAGCVGPLIGYAATTNALPVSAWVLFLMIFVWTPAHFWALAIFLSDDYDRAGIPMLPVTKGIDNTVQQIIFYSVLYIATIVGFYFVNSSMHLVYLFGSILLSVWFLALVYKLYKLKTKQFAKKFFFYSILHLFLVNILILIDFQF